MRVLLLAILSFTAASCHAPAAKHTDSLTATEREHALAVGDAAPALSIDAWVKGQAVLAFEKGHVYVVDFWALWCGGCIAGMPEMTQLQRDFAKDGVVVVAATCGDPDNTLDGVRAFTSKKDDDFMGFRVAFDGSGKLHRDWLDHGGVGGIPYAFVVGKDGRIVYSGHPAHIRALMPRILSGEFDADAAVAQFRANIGKPRESVPMSSKMPSMHTATTTAAPAAKIEPQH
jgi:thiol-disulfide isomerase/thioredoxin